MKINPAILSRLGRGLLASAVCIGSMVGCSLSNATASSDGSTSAAASFDQQFIDMMTPHHQSAVMMATTAQQRGEHAELKTMASEIIAAQSKEIAEMKTWRKQWHGSDETPPMDKMPMLPGMEGHSMPDMMMTNEALKTASPFDKAFIDAMIPHHEMAIDAATIAQGKATHPEIQDMANKIVDTQQKEITQLKAWRTAWYPGP